MKQPINQGSLKILELIYKGAQKKIVKILKSSTNYKKEDQENIRKRIDIELAKLDKGTKKWTEREVERNYQAGARAAYFMLKSVEDKL